MNIIIDEKLRELRSIRGNKQEDLAEHIGVSTQSVSKWERGETLPDITFLPQIAEFYSVSVDELLGVEEIRKQNRIEEYAETLNGLNHKGLSDDVLRVCREAQKEFPNNMWVLHQLAYALFNRYGRTDDDMREAIQLGERILRECTEQDLREGAIQLICFCYDNLGDKENAKKYAYMSGYELKNTLLETVLEGAELAELCKNSIQMSIEKIGYTIYHLDGVTSVEQAIANEEWYLKLLAHLYDDGNYGFWHLRVLEHNVRLASLCVKAGDEKKCRESLEAAMYHADKYDSIYGKVITHNSTVLKSYEYDMRGVSSTRPISSSVELQEYLNESRFDCWRDRDWFKAIVEELKAAK